jgi:hypothetical protein
LPHQRNDWRPVALPACSALRSIWRGPGTSLRRASPAGGAGRFPRSCCLYLAEILKTVGQVDPSAQPVLIALATRATFWLFAAYGVLAVAASVGFAWLTVAIARRKTLYPRWVALANPLVCMLAGSLIDRVLPQPFKLLLAGAGLSLGLLVFFALSTVVLWNSPLSAAAPK